MVEDFVPAHAAHSIDHVSASVAFNGYLSGTDWLQVLLAAESCARELDLPIYADAIGAQVIPDSPSPGDGRPAAFNMSVSGIGGTFRSADESIPQGFQFTRSELRVETSAYVRWQGFAEFLNQILTSVLPGYVDHIPIGQIRLEYRDRYIQRVGLERANLPAWGQVIKASSFMPVFGTNRIEPWHSHVGWFEAHDEDRRRLVNLNVDTNENFQYSPTELERTIFVHSLVGLQGPFTREHTRSELVSKEFFLLHERSKSVLSSILTESMQKSISLRVDEKLI
ncbi:TIGR04255 family protein [Microvirga sp. CF3062]|uniref:TIGR04255 family protein n=1 Tax=Microvirga sp. CF3062 TaxID=3110182 RepID=UPI002E76363C|nr:TIGR04255 family protein [Microvirga sp. CF3062]MEE1655733.1 TIGR04255 family protein [Microvirga sp. CF3062]